MIVSAGRKAQFNIKAHHPLPHPVVARGVLVVDPVEALVAAVLDAVLGDPLVRVAAALGQDARHHAHLLQVHLQKLASVLELGQPGTPWQGKKSSGITVTTYTVRHQGPLPVSSLVAHS